MQLIVLEAVICPDCNGTGGLRPRCRICDIDIQMFGIGDLVMPCGHTAIGALDMGPLCPRCDGDGTIFSERRANDLDGQ